MYTNRRPTDLICGCTQKEADNVNHLKQSFPVPLTWLEPEKMWRWGSVTPLTAIYTIQLRGKNRKDTTGTKTRQKYESQRLGQNVREPWNVVSSFSVALMLLFCSSFFTSYSHSGLLLTLSPLPPTEQALSWFPELSESKPLLQSQSFHLLPWSKISAGQHQTDKLRPLKWTDLTCIFSFRNRKEDASQKKSINGKSF